MTSVGTALDETPETRGEGTVSVLCVDDEPAVLEVTTAFLERERSTIDTLSATSATEALELLETHDIDCVVSDYQMPKMDGLDLLERVRSMNDDLPFILFTGKGSEEIASKAIFNGVTDYLQKEPGSHQYTVLANRVENAIARHRAVLRFSDVIESVPDGIILVDTGGQIKHANGRIEEQFGYDRDELVGKSVETLIPERYHDDHIQDRKQYATSPERRPMGAGLELCGRRLDGTEFPVDISLSPMRVGSELEVVASIRDRSEWEPATDHEGGAFELEQRFQLLVESVTEYAIFLLDTTGRVVTWNAGAQHIKGYTKPEIIGEHFSMFYTAPDREDGIPEQNLETAARAGSVEDEGWRVRADGSRFWASITITAMYDETGELTGYGKVTQDMTDGREYEQQLERQNERLADFASVISHDLMNPLLVAASSLDLAREDSAPENFDRIEAALKRMDVLIADLRTLAVEGQAVEDTELVSLEAVAESAWETTQRDGASLEVLVDDYVEADQARLRQLLENLLSNAVTHGGSDVTIWVGQLDDRDGFYVADDGPGIPTAIQADVFERGYTTSETGTGFGLSIVREIANAHGWTIQVTDSAEGGARFEVRFE